MRTSAEEVALLQTDNILEQKVYILWYGFHSTEGQILLASSKFDELIRLQTMLYGNIWCPEAEEILLKRSLLPYPPDDENEVLEQGVKTWLKNSLIADRGDEANYGKLQFIGLSYGLKPHIYVTEKEQLSWIEDNNTEKICSYTGCWIGEAAVKFLEKAPDEAIYKKLRYVLLKTEREQMALVEREINRGENSLLWFYFSKNQAFSSVQQRIQLYDTNLWSRMIMVNYGWDSFFEKKFGNLAVWQEKLSANLAKLLYCPIEEIEDKLRSIA